MVAQAGTIPPHDSFGYYVQRGGPFSVTQFASTAGVIGALMNSQFSTVHNFNEAAIFREITRAAALYPALSDQPELLADVACVALNRMPPRYIRNNVDTIFYMSDDDHSRHAVAVTTAVKCAFEFVQTRTARGTA
jgi:hypothetical protein